MKRFWEESEEQYIRDHWGKLSVDAIANHLDRSVYAVYNRARFDLRLKIGCPDGYEYVHHAAVRYNTSGFQMKKILAEAGVLPRRSMSRQCGSHFNQRIVRPEETDRAMERWRRMETLSDAARRYNVTVFRMRSRLINANVAIPVRCQRELDPNDVDRAMALESIADAARRLSVDYSTLRVKARQQGLYKGHRDRQLFPPEVWNALSTERARCRSPEPLRLEAGNQGRRKRRADNERCRGRRRRCSPVESDRSGEGLCALTEHAACGGERGP